MDEFQRMQLRMACLEMAKQVALATQSTYSIESMAETYWQWATKKDAPKGFAPAAPKTDDDIPF